MKEAVNNVGSLSVPRAASVRDTLGVAASLRLHWPEYLMEAGQISLFMFCICSFATLLQHPASPVRHLFVSGIVRRALMGLAIGATVITLREIEVGILCSPDCVAERQGFEPWVQVLARTTV